MDRTKRNKNKLNSVDDYAAFSLNYYALYACIVKNKTGKESLKDFGLLL